MNLKSNLVLKIIALFVVAVLIVIIAKGKKSDAGDSGGEAAASELTPMDGGPSDLHNGLEFDPLEAKVLADEYGADVDSPKETMRTLTEETRSVREHSEKLQEENKVLKREITRLLEMEDTINKRVNSKFNAAEKDAEKSQRELEHTQDMTKGLISKLERRLEELSAEDKSKTGKASAHGYDINASGIPTGLGFDNTGAQVNYDQIVWVNPVDAKVDPKDPSSVTVPDFSRGIDAIVELAPAGQQREKKRKEDRSIKAYTIPDNATLMGSVALTAMLGRIPTNGQVVDPYPFKVIVGEKNLSSNGIHIPGVNGITMSGVAKGDWTLSCVSGEIYSMTFTFQDGTIVSVPEPGVKTEEPLAWFSDRNGVPCITGKRITNAPSYLSQRIGLTGASSYANAKAQSQYTNTVSEGASTSTLTGDPTLVAQNTAISSGLNEVTDWLDARMENSFDAIYIAPGTPLVLHVVEELRIDYDPEGRKVNHYADLTKRTDTHLD